MTPALLVDDERLPATRHELLSSSSGAAAPLALVSAPQAAFQVTTLADVVDASDGVLSLREAVAQANSAPGRDTITFAPSLQGGTILLDRALGTIRITGDLTIDGDAQNRGAGGIRIDGNTDWDASPYAVESPLSVDSASVRLEDLTVQRALYTGIQASNATLDLERVTVRAINGHASLQGYGIEVSGGSLRVADSTIGYTTVELSVGIQLGDGANVLVERSLITGNGAYGYGIRGAGTVRVVDSVVSDNGFYGGFGIAVRGDVIVEHSTLTGNGSSSGDGGGAILVDGSLRLVNSTVAANYAGSGGDFTPNRPGASIGVLAGSRAEIINSTLTGTLGEKGAPADEPALGIGIWAGNGSNVRVVNSLVDDDVVGQIFSNGANTFRDATVAGAIAGDRLGVAAETLFAVTRDLGGGVRAGVLADNGGPTPTVALRGAADNPAIGGAEVRFAPATDQRGVPRDAAPDIGAYERDTAVPTVAIALGDQSLIAGETATVTFTFSEPVRGFTQGDISLAGTSGSLAGLVPAGGNSWIATFTPTAGVERPANSIAVKVGSYTDLAGNPGAAGTSPSFAIDTKPPTLAIAVSDPVLSMGETATLTFTFSEPVTGFAASDIDVPAAVGRLAGPTQATPTSWTAIFTPNAGVEAAVDALGVRAGTYTDAAGNPGGGARAPLFIVDTRPPTVTVAVGDASLIAGETATVTFSFSEPVTGFDLGDVDLAGAAGSLASLAGSGAVRTALFTPTPGAEQAANSIAVTAGSYADLRGNPGGSGSSARFAVDTKPPTLAIDISDGTLTRGETATVTFAFSEAVSGFELADIDLAEAAGSLSTLAGTGAVRTATFTPAADFEQATNSIAVAAGSYADLAGNPGAGAVSPTFRVDTAPSVPPGTLGPVAVDDLFAVNAAEVARKGARLAVLANDVARDAKLVPASLALAEPPENGTATLKKGVIVYQPAPGFAGTELLEYTVQDKARLTSNVALVTIEVTQPPLTQAVDDSFTVDGATVGTKGARLDILANDIPGFGKLDAKSVLITDAPDDGTFTLKKGVVTYLPDAGFEGTDSLAYTVADATGRASDPATVTITVTQPPLAQAVDDSFLVDAASVPRNGVKLDILVNDVPGFGRLDPKSVLITDLPDNGTVSVGKGVLLYIPTPGSSGLDTLSYTVADATGRPSNQATVTIDVRNPAALALADLLDDTPAPASPAAPLATAASAPALDTLLVAAEVG